MHTDAAERHANTSYSETYEKRDRTRNQKINIALTSITQIRSKKFVPHTRTCVSPAVVYDGAALPHSFPHDLHHRLERINLHRPDFYLLPARRAFIPWLRRPTRDLRLQLVESMLRKLRVELETQHPVLCIGILTYLGVEYADALGELVLLLMLLVLMLVRVAVVVVGALRVQGIVGAIIGVQRGVFGEGGGEPGRET